MRPFFVILLVVLPFLAVAAFAYSYTDCPDKCIADTLYYNGYFQSGSCQFLQEDCNRHDREIGDKFCKGNDVYIKYENWYCTPGGCEKATYDNKVEECGSGDCEDGMCLYDCDDDCDIRDGFYGDPYCLFDNVYREYRNYYCSHGSCLYSEFERKVDECYYGCENGNCKGTSCASKCVENVFYHSGKIVTGSCEYSKRYCDDFDEEVSARYCEDNKVYVKLRDYYCDNGCKSVIYEKEVEECGDIIEEGSWYIVDEDTRERVNTQYVYICERGKCVQDQVYTIISREAIEKAPESAEKQRSFEFDIDISSYSSLEESTYADTRIYNGLFFGSREIVMEIEAMKSVSFTVDKTNSYGSLIITLNDSIIYQDMLLPGDYSVPINGSGTLKIIAASSFWRIWAPAVYDLRDIVVIAESISVNKNEFDFVIESNEYENFNRAEITIPENTSIILNDVLITDSEIDKINLKQGRNMIEFIPWPETTFSGNSVLTIWYEEA